MDYTVLKRDELTRDGNSAEFEGYLHGDTSFSLIWVNMPPGRGVRLHKHPYQEVFVIQEGQVTFTVGSNTTTLQGGHIVIVPPGVPHKFINSGEKQLVQIDIHQSPQFITEWLED